MEKDNINDDEKVIYVIDKEGKITSIKRINGEEYHYESYIRLNIDLGGIIGEITKHDSRYTLPNRVAKLGFINICALDIYKTIIDKFLVVFPIQPTESELESIKALYGVLEGKKVYFFKKPRINSTWLDFSQRTDKEGKLEELEEFVEEELKKLRENRKKNEGR